MAESLPLMTALFADHERAERACASLAARGYTPVDLRVLMTGDTRERLLAAAVRRGRSAGALGALVTALVAPRISEERARVYDRGVCEGGLVLGIVPRTAQDAQSIRQEWTLAGGTDIMCPLLRESDAAA
jgi:hypothetical protein